MSNTSNKCPVNGQSPVTLRPELGKLPPRMESLPVDRGYPVPWFVDWIDVPDGDKVPEFRAMSLDKWVRAVKERLCWVCGQPLGSYLAFVIGPMCGITRTTSEPPCHLDCAIWSAQNCPFLTRPNMVRRDLEKEYPHALKPAGYHIDRNPGATLVWVTKGYKVFSDGMGGYLIKVGEPTSISCWAEGRPATPEEIDESITTGLPFLIKNAKTVEDLQEIAAMTESFRKRLGI